MTARLMLGDCLERMREIEAGSVDLVLCDLPYGTTACKWDAVIPFAPLWTEYRRVTKLNAAIVLTASQPFTAALVMSNPGWFRHEWIWIKSCGSNFANTVREPFKEHESVLVFSAGKWTYNKQMQERAGGGLERSQYTDRSITTTPAYGQFHRPRNERAALRVPSSYQNFNVERGLHPTQKPVALLEYLIRTYSQEGETVLDNTMGSGSTGVACLNTHRQFIGIERDPGYFAVAEQRLAAVRQKELAL